MFGHTTYIAFELAWAVPVLCVQWVFGQEILWSRRRSLLLTVLLATTYLSCTDGIAISQGIWTLHRDRILGAYVANVPVEEIIFFLLTNLLVIQSVLLVYGMAGGLGHLRLPSHRR